MSPPEFRIAGIFGTGIIPGVIFSSIQQYLLGVSYNS